MRVISNNDSEQARNPHTPVIPNGSERAQEPDDYAMNRKRSSGTAQNPPIHRESSTPCMHESNVAALCRDSTLHHLLIRHSELDSESRIYLSSRTYVRDPSFIPSYCKPLAAQQYIPGPAGHARRQSKWQRSAFDTCRASGDLGTSRATPKTTLRVHASRVGIRRSRLGNS